MITTIVGTQWGDEGKGKLTDYFSEDADVIVRFQGGNNAGHTIKIGENVFKLHLIPSGMMRDDKICIIGSGCVIDPAVLLEELAGLESMNLTSKLYISQRAHVIMPYHKALDECISTFQDQLAAGSTKRGIAPVCGDKMYRFGIRIVDLLEPGILREKLEKAYSFNTQILEKVFNKPFDQTFEEVFEEMKAVGDNLRQYVTDTEVLLWNLRKEGKSILFEGAQGMSLDPDHGIYPYTTSTNNVASYAGVGSGIGINEPVKIIGVTKAYVSRVGQSPFPTELFETEAENLRTKGNEFGTTTGRPRRVGWLDMVQVRQAIRVSGVTDIALTKLDILCGFPEIQVCTHYQNRDLEIREMPASLTAYREAKPVYITLPGWKELTNEEIEMHCSAGYDSLPENMKWFIEFVEAETGCDVSIISLGPERTQTIMR